MSYRIKIKGFFSFVANRYTCLGQRLATGIMAGHGPYNVSFKLGVLTVLQTFGACRLAFAQSEFDASQVDQTRLQDAIKILMTYIEGPFGALVAVCSGLGAILSSAFGQYKAALFTSSKEGINLGFYKF